ncbi:hypothetical protein Dda_1054 [Drechslerella dactyloides]|uniref:Uncharacterized protein n=1 Tax=Drechslerella dactyloides TaxID=74499 RepID=A0AAD6J8I6_DREDA|nr:hypothetical protein Dda_1054 [Drechslerella dactyloides]
MQHQRFYSHNVNHPAASNLDGTTTIITTKRQPHPSPAAHLYHSPTMSRAPHCESKGDASHQLPPGSPPASLDLASLGQQDHPTSPHSAASVPRKSKASTFSILSFAPPRRPALSHGTFDPNLPPYRHVSAGASAAVAPVTQETNVESARAPIAPQHPSTSHKENRKVSAELTKQLENLLKPASRSTSGSSSRANPVTSSSSSSWAVTSSSIAIRHSSPVQSVTTETWEPPPEVEPSPTPSPPPVLELQSEYFSFPPFDSYLGKARPGLRTKRSDKSWVLLQKLKGKLVEMHNNGQLERSGRSSSRTSLSSGKSRPSHSPAKPPKSRSDTTHSARRRASEGEATGQRPELGLRGTGKAATVAERSTRLSGLGQNMVSQEPDGNATASPEVASTTQTEDPQINPSPSKHITIVESDPPADIHNGSKSPGKAKESSNIVEFTQNIASSIFQSLVTIATGDASEQSVAPSSTSREGSFRGKGSTTSPYRSKEPRSGKGKEQRDESSADSSEDELTFMEYVKRFSDGSPPPMRQISRLVSPVGAPPPSMGTTPETTDKDKEAMPRTVTFKDHPVESTHTPAEASDSEAPDSPNKHEYEASSSRKTTTDEDGLEQFPYRAEDYTIITEYFYNTQGRLLREKWPFLYDNEVKYLIDSKWLEMEWEDLEEWAQESANHIDEEGYVEPDLFEDITLVDPRSLGQEKKEDDMRRATAG